MTESNEMAIADAPWWARGIVYQIYPRSFQDTNGDGVGDLEGIRRRLPYLRWLGVDAIWISPFYPSPMADFGYDVADYCGVDPLFGSLADFDALIRDAHGHGLKVILDFVPNHTSDQHPWFVESRSSRINAKRSWYIWRDGRPDGRPPNNWVSNFGGSGWEFDPATDQYYYHAFLKEQPDLNWRNPDLRGAMHDVLRFWLDRGVDGFRVDVIWHLIKEGTFRDNPINPAYAEGRPEIESLLQVYSADQPEVHDIIRELRGVLEEYDDRVLIGEIYLPLERLVAYYGSDLTGAHLPFNFQLIHAAWDARHLKRIIREYEAALPPRGWPNWVLGNHDQKRIASRVGEEQARIAAMLLMTLRGTPTLYYGDELGMEQVPIEGDDVHDPWEKNEPGLGFGRDPARTPMQWDASPGAGFTGVKPWLPLEESFPTRNVAAQRDDPRSMLSLVRGLLAVRNAHPALAIGAYREIDAPDSVLAFERRHGEERIVVLLNLGPDPVRFEADAVARGEILIAARPDGGSAIEGTSVDLAGDDGMVVHAS